jgi:hypothetical protein
MAPLNLRSWADAPGESAGKPSFGSHRKSPSGSGKENLWLTPVLGASGRTASPVRSTSPSKRHSHLLQAFDSAQQQHLQQQRGVDVTPSERAVASNMPAGNNQPAPYTHAASMGSEETEPMPSPMLDNLQPGQHRTEVWLSVRSTSPSKQRRQQHQHQQQQHRDKAAAEQQSAVVPVDTSSQPVGRRQPPCAERSVGARSGSSANGLHSSAASPQRGNGATAPAAVDQHSSTTSCTDGTQAVDTAADSAVSSSTAAHAEKRSHRSRSSLEPAPIVSGSGNVHYLYNQATHAAPAGPHSATEHAQQNGTGAHQFASDSQAGNPLADAIMVAAQGQYSPGVAPAAAVSRAAHSAAGGTAADSDQQLHSSASAGGPAGSLSATTKPPYRAGTAAAAAAVERRRAEVQADAERLTALEARLTAQQAEFETQKSAADAVLVREQVNASTSESL